MARAGRRVCGVCVSFCHELVAWLWIKLVTSWKFNYLINEMQRAFSYSCILETFEWNCCANRKYKIIIIWTKPQWLFIDYLLIIFNNMTAEFVDIQNKCLFSCKRLNGVQYWRSAEHIFTEEKFKEHLFCFICEKRETKTQTEQCIACYSLFLFFKHLLSWRTKPIQQN